MSDIQGMIREGVKAIKSRKVLQKVEPAKPTDENFN